MRKNDSSKNILLNTVSAAFGLMLFGFGIYLTIQANVGVDPWSVLCFGVSGSLHILYGNASILIALVLIVVDVAMGEKIGIGTLLDAVVVGKTVDLLNWLDLIPKCTSIVSGLIMLLVAFFIMGWSQYFYMKSGLCCGPRDSFQITLGRRMPKVPMGAVYGIILLVVLILGLLLGGKDSAGIGTIISPVASGFLQQLAFNIMHFEPKDVEHQGFFKSLRIIFGKKESAGMEKSADDAQPVADRKPAILLDIDGTLWDTTGVVAGGWNKAIKLEGLDLPEVTADRLKKEFGKTMDAIADSMWPGLDAEKKADLLKKCCYHEHIAVEENTENITYSGVVETIREMKDRVDFFIVSNCQDGYIELTMKKNGITGYIRDFECFGHTGLGKPENIRLLMKRNGIEEAYYVGDTQGDYEACKKADVKFIWASYGFGKPEAYFAKIDRFSDLKNMF